MNPPKCDDLDYIHFLIASQKVFTLTEAARCQPKRGECPCPRCLHQTAFKKAFKDLRKGLLIMDDTTLDKPYARKMDLVTYHWSEGFALLTLLWTVGFIKVFRMVSKEGGRLMLGEQRP